MNDAVLRAAAPPQVRPRGAAAGPDGLMSLAQILAANSAEFSKGVLEGLFDALKSTVKLVAHDLWQLDTYKELATTGNALRMLAWDNIGPGVASAEAYDARHGTHVAQRQAEILDAVNKLRLDAPHWTPRQWGYAVGIVVGNVILAKGAGAGVKMAARGTLSLARTTVAVEEGASLFHSTSRAGAAENILKGINPKFFNPEARFGGAFYTATRPSTTVAELAHHGATNVNTLKYTLGAGGRFLNLTSPIGKFGTRYTPKLLARYARFTNKNAIIAYSLRMKGGVNVIVLQDFSILQKGVILP